MRELLILVLAVACPCEAQEFSPGSPLANSDIGAWTPTLERPRIGATFGQKLRNRLSVYRPAGTGMVPMILLLSSRAYDHGGDRAFSERLATAFIKRGYAVAYIGSRALRTDGLRMSAVDVAAGVAHIYQHAERFHVAGPFGIVGFGDGAGLGALLGSAPEILTAAGVNFADLHAVAGINSEGLDGPRTVERYPTFASSYKRIFGKDAASQTAASAIGHTGQPNAPAFWFLEFGAESKPPEAEAFGVALRSANTPAGIERVPKKDPHSWYDLGDPTFAAGERLIEFVVNRLR